MIKRSLIALAVALAATFGMSASAWATPAPAATPALLAGHSCYPGNGLHCKNKTTAGNSTSGSSKKSTSPASEPTSTTPASPSVLAFTGADVVVTLAVGALLVALGLVVVQLTRRRTA